MTMMTNSSRVLSYINGLLLVSLLPISSSFIQPNHVQNNCAKCTHISTCRQISQYNNVKLYGFFDDFMQANFGSDKDVEQKQMNAAVDDDEIIWNESDFQSEVKKRQQDIPTEATATSPSNVMIIDGEEVEFDGYMVRAEKIKHTNTKQFYFWNRR